MSKSLKEIQDEIVNLQKQEKRLLEDAETQRAAAKLVGCEKQEAVILYCVRPFGSANVISYHKFREGALDACTGFDMKHSRRQLSACGSFSNCVPRQNKPPSTLLGTCAILE